jgi:hypothetical protein
MTDAGRGDAAGGGSHYYPWWLDNLAQDVTGEGAFIGGAVHGAENVHALVSYARQLYEFQDFSFHDYYADDRFLEQYTTSIQGQPAAVVVTIRRNAAGKAQHVVVNHRPRNAVLLLARLCGEKFEGTPLGELFTANGAAQREPEAHGGPSEPTYIGDPARGNSGYYPLWLDNLADDASLEGAAMNGAVQGAEAVRSVVVAARTLYEFQDFSFHDEYGENGFLEDYTSSVHGKPVGVVVTVARNADGKAQRVAVNHRPTSSMLLFSRSMGEKFAGTPIAGHFAAG